MPIVVEDGTIVAGANSYSTLAAIKSYAELRQRVLPDDDVLLTAYTVRAMDYLASFRDRYKGERTSLTQVLDFPRTGVILDDRDPATGEQIEIGPNEMPVMLLDAHMLLTVEVANGLDLQPILIMQDRVKRKKIGPLETEWFDGHVTGIAPVITHIDLMLAPLLNMWFALRTIRV